MFRVFITVKLIVVLFFSFAPVISFAGTCSGGANCTACKNCKYCKHCSVKGGSCSVCSKTVKLKSYKR